MSLNDKPSKRHALRGAYVANFILFLIAVIAINVADAQARPPDKEAVNAVLDEIKDYAYNLSKSHLSGKGKACTEYDAANASRINIIIMLGLEEFEHKGKGVVLFIEASTPALIEMVSHYKCINDAAFLLDMLRTTYEKNGGTKNQNTFKQVEEIIRLSP